MRRNVLAAGLAGAVTAFVLVPAAPATAAPKPAKRVAAPKPVRPAPKPRPARYVVVGTLAAVDGSTVTLAPTTGGNARTKPAPVTFAVPDGAVVIRDDAPATLADLAPGDHVAASGTRSGTDVTIAKVVATSPEPVPDSEPQPV